MIKRGFGVSSGSRFITRRKGFPYIISGNILQLDHFPYSLLLGILHYMKKTTKNQPMPQVSLGTAYNLVDALIAKCVERENAKSPVYPSGYAYCTGMLSALLADAIAKLPAKEGQEFVARINRRIEENN